jgi:hypothetical protein
MTKKTKEYKITGHDNRKYSLSTEGDRDGWPARHYKNLDKLVKRIEELESK